MRIEILYPPAGPHDAIATHGHMLAEALSEQGHDARFVTGGARRLLRLVTARQADWLVLQYMPYSYGRWGFAPLLVGAALAARLLPGAPQLALMVHEAYSSDARGVRGRLMGLWQREQFRALVALSPCVLASTQDNRATATRLVPRRETVHAPIPATIRPEGFAREPARVALGITPDELVVTILGGGHPSRALGHVEAAVAALEAAGHRCVLLNLGAQPPALDLPAGVRVLAPGPLPARELSRRLAATDVYLVPFHDGVSTRRTTLTVALAHGLAIVGTDGERTDALLRAWPQALVLAPVDGPHRFAAATVELAGRPERREELGRSARALYAAELGWPVVAGRAAGALAAARTASRSGRRTSDQS